MFESILKDEITDHLTTNNLFANEQHDFRTGRSCTIQLISVD